MVNIQAKNVVYMCIYIYIYIHIHIHIHIHTYIHVYVKTACWPCGCCASSRGRQLGLLPAATCGVPVLGAKGRRMISRKVVFSGLLRRELRPTGAVSGGLRQSKVSSKHCNRNK